MIHLLLLLTAISISIAIIYSRWNSLWIVLPLFLLIVFSDQSPTFLLPVFFLVLTPIIISNYKNNREQIQLNNQLPHLIETLSISLKSGITLEASLREALQNTKKPLHKMLNEIIHNLNLGSSLEEALSKQEKKWNSLLLKRFVHAIKMSRDSGMDISKLFDALTQDARHEAALSEKIMSMSAQGRLQAFILGIMPFVLLGLLSLLEPVRIESFIRNPQGKVIIGLMIILELIGLIWIRKLMRI